MNNFELEFQLGTNSEETPIDALIQELLTAGTKNPWAHCPDCGSGVAGFRLDDKERNYIISLFAEAQTEDYFQTVLEVKNPDGSTEMRSMEWIAAGNSGPLLTLYGVLSQALLDQTKGATDSEGIDPEDDATLTDAFVDALIRDVQGTRHRVTFERKGNGFIADGFGISESTITLTQEDEDDTHARFLIKLEKQNGDVILSCLETSRHTDEEAEVRKLYRLLDEQVPIVTIDEATEDVRRFVERSNFDAFFDRVLTHAQPELPAITSEDIEGKVLIYDLFTSVGETAVIRQFLDEIAIRRGPLDEPSYKRLKALAQSVFSMMRNTKREPNGRVFTSHAVAVAYDKPGLASRGVRWSSCLSRIANSYTTWFDLVGQNPAIGEGRAMQMCAVLILTAILKDQIPC